MRTVRALVVGAVVIGLGILLAELRVNPYIYFAGYVVLQYVVIATAWNVLGGYAGYVNFGTPAFFALGAYTSIALIEAFKAPLPVLILCGGLVTALLGLGIGYLTLRLKGVFFSIATFALSVVVQTLIINWDYVGGAKGYTLIRPPAPVFGNWGVLLFTLMVVLAVVRALVDRARAGRAARQRGGRRVHGRADPSAEALCDDAQRLFPRCGRGAVSLLRDLRRAGVDL